MNYPSLKLPIFVIGGVLGNYQWFLGVIKERGCRRWKEQIKRFKMALLSFFGPQTHNCQLC